MATFEQIFKIKEGHILNEARANRALHARSGRRIRCSRRHIDGHPPASAQAPGSRGGEEMTVVRNEQHRALKLRQGPDQHFLGQEVEVVGRLV